MHVQSLKYEVTITYLLYKTHAKVTNSASATSVFIFNIWTFCLFITDTWCLGVCITHCLNLFLCSLHVLFVSAFHTQSKHMQVRPISNSELAVKKCVGAMWRVHGVPCLLPSVIEEDRPQPQQNKASAKKKDGRNEQLVYDNIFKTFCELRTPPFVLY